MRALLDNSNQEERRTAIIGRKLSHYSLDILALSETKLPEASSLEEVGAGYTIFCSGNPETPRNSGVRFFIRTSLASKRVLSNGHIRRTDCCTFETQETHLCYGSKCLCTDNESHR